MTLKPQPERFLITALEENVQGLHPQWWKQQPPDIMDVFTTLASAPNLYPGYIASPSGGIYITKEERDELQAKFWINYWKTGQGKTAMDEIRKFLQEREAAKIQRFCKPQEN